MAIYLVDTNVLLRYHDAGSNGYEMATRALASLVGNGDSLVVAAQNLIEFWRVATRPRENNGLGWTPEQARSAIQSLLDDFGLLEDAPQILRDWQRLVVRYGVREKKVHDTRLVAVMLSYGIELLLTFNNGRFRPLFRSESDSARRHHLNFRSFVFLTYSALVGP